MPRQDAQGRWISDDGLSYWDGTAWRPTGVQAAVRQSSPWPAILIGCALVAVVLVVLAVAGVVLLFSNADVQRSFCNGYTSSDSNLVCPFHPPPTG
jgi:hypothetical protein